MRIHSKFQATKKQSVLLILCFAAFSCDTDPGTLPKFHPLLGDWDLETVYLGRVNSGEFELEMEGANFLAIRSDKSYSRAYDNGRWDLSGRTLRLDREEWTRMPDWTYKIIEYSYQKLVLELEVTEGKYCCNFEEFESDDVLRIREVYRRRN